MGSHETHTRARETVASRPRRTSSAASPHPAEASPLKEISAWGEPSARDLQDESIAEEGHSVSPSSFSSSFRFTPPVTKGNNKDPAASGSVIRPHAVPTVLLILLVLFFAVEMTIRQPLQRRSILQRHPPMALSGPESKLPGDDTRKQVLAALEKNLPRKHHRLPGGPHRGGEQPKSIRREDPAAAAKEEWDTFDEGVAAGDHLPKAAEAASAAAASTTVEGRGPLRHIGEYPAEDSAKAAVLEANLIIKGKPKTVMQHSATIAEAKDGSLVAAWFGGLWEAKPDVGIWMSNYKAGQWGPAYELVAPGRDGPCWNPVLCSVPKTGELLLFYKVGPTPKQWTGKLMRSLDGGHTWGQPEVLPKGITGPSKNKCFFTEDGTLLAPSSREAGGKGSTPQAKWTSHVEYSRDNGRTWNRTQNIDYKGKIIQPSLVLGSDGNVRMLLRERGPETPVKYLESNVLLAVSDRSGLTWTAPVQRTNLPCPNTGLDAVRLRDGRLLIAFNDSMRTRYAARMTLGLAVSTDDGASWRRLLRLEHSEKAVKEFSYPSMILGQDGRVHIVYTWSEKKVVPQKSGRENIKHVVIDPAKLPAL